MTDLLTVRRFSRRHLITGAAGSSLPTAMASRGTHAADDGAGEVEPASNGGWTLYGADLAGTRVSQATRISSLSVASLGQSWSVEVGAPVSGTPVIAGGVVYLGAYNGTLFAFDLASGAPLWTYETGAAVPEPNLNIELGILGSAAVAGDVIFVGDATATVHALDAASGALRWQTRIDEQTAACIWSSPIAANGVVYVGVASVAKEAGFRGNVVALDATSGSPLWKTYSVPGESDGGGVFAVPAVDLDRGLLYVGAQNAYSPNPAPYGNPTSVLALELANGAERWVFNAPPGGGPTAPTDDVGFSASPNLFSATLFGRQRDLVGVGQKSGIFWALDRDTGEMVWRTQVAPAGPLGGMEGTSAIANGQIVIPATNWPDPAGPATGLVAGLDASTGKIVWTVDLSAPAASPVAIAGDVVLQAGLDGVLRVLALRSGQVLWQADLGSSVSGGIAVSGDSVVVAAATPSFAPFVRPGTSVFAFALGQETGATPTITPIGDGTG